MHNVTDILQAFESGDFARSNLFEVEIYHLGQSFRFRCKATEVPASTVEKVAVGYMNRKLNIAGDRTYDDWPCTIYNDDEHDIRTMLVDWSDSAHGATNKITGDTPAEYKKIGTIRQIKRDGETVGKEYTLVGVWPTNVGQVQLDWDTNNEVQVFEVTFAIDWVE